MKKLLVIDDDPAVRKLVRRCFPPPEYEVLEAADGDEAIGMAAEAKPDLVLLDIHLPRLDGIAAIGEILVRSPRTAVVMLTGDHSEARARTALERGACDYLTKPFTVQTLKTCVTANLLVREI